MKLMQLFELMWQDYTQISPQAQKIYDLFTSFGEVVVNDHIALRTFQSSKLGIGKMAQVFIANGYRKNGEYEFVEKKLYAEHFEHSDASMPKVFISELKVTELPVHAQKIVNRLISEVPEHLPDDPLFVVSGRPWQVSLKDYDELIAVSEYAAWMAAFGFRPNHFTISLNHFKKLNDIYKVNELLKAEGFDLNASGGEVKGTPQELLEQSSTRAAQVPVVFSDGQRVLPSCYYEFAKRHPQANGQLYSGFIAASADKIFESTNVKREL